MKRYIKLDEWEKHFDKMMAGCPLPKKTIAKIKQMWIDGMPTADVVEVVRCKDCRSGYPEIENDNGKIEVYYYCDGDCCYHSGNDYCSDGERRDADV